MSIPKVDLEKVISNFSLLQRYGTPYGYGAKPEGGSDPRNGRRWNPRSNKTLDTPIDTIDNIDCSGFVRYVLYKASDRKLDIGDGSQNQRNWFEEKARLGFTKQITKYENCAQYMTKTRLFICFIRPGHRGCGPVGHVWLLANIDNDPVVETMESYGGVGVGSRVWNTSVLRRQFYSAFEIPTK